MDNQRRLASDLGYARGRTRLPSTHQRRLIDGRESPVNPAHRPVELVLAQLEVGPAGRLPRVLFVGVAFVAAAFFLALGIMKQSDAYKIAVDRAQQNHAVIDALGSPISAGTFVSGSSHVEGPTGDAKPSIPLSGPKGKGTLYVEATKSAGVWQFGTLVVKIEKTGEQINLNQTSPLR